MVVDRTELAAGAEYCDAIQLKANFGIDRGHAYDLIHEGLIESKNLKRRNAQRGKRLFRVSSVRRYLASLNDDMSPIFANTPEGLRMREEKRRGRTMAAKYNKRREGSK